MDNDANLHGTETPDAIASSATPAARTLLNEGMSTIRESLTSAARGLHWSIMSASAFCQARGVISEHTSRLSGGQQGRARVKQTHTAGARGCCAGRELTMTADSATRAVSDLADKTGLTKAADDAGVERGTTAAAQTYNAEEVSVRTPLPG